MEFSTKARTLAALSGKLNSASILPLEIINGDDYFSSKQKVVESLRRLFPAQRLIVRSSSSNEDTYHSSAAGKYLSVLNVDSTDSLSLENAIESVFASYNTGADSEEVLVQPMLMGLRLSGVAFTCDMNTGAPYYVINYSAGSDTQAVTGGGEPSQTFIAYKNSLEYIYDKAMLSVIAALQELQLLFEDERLDVEFGVTELNEVYIFQARPLTRCTESRVSISLDVPLNKLFKKIEKLMRPHPFLDGTTTCFGVMPDWNPAEILGVRPKKLAISLYKELITDNIWAHQRSNYGYRNLILHPLMVSFCGVPYIDVRVSFNSFIPKGLHPLIAEKLANYYIRKFKDYPIYHDKVEFEIVHSCYYFGIPEHLSKLLDYGFTENEIRRIEFSLLSLTNNIINPQNSLYRQDIENVNKLVDNHRTIINSDISVIDKIYWLIEECKTYGTLPFAGVARAGFIAVQFLRSFVAQGICTGEEYNAFMKSLQTVSKKLGTDRYALSLGKLTEGEFLKKYGHIRPDTYNILSPRYDEAFEKYFGQLYSEKPAEACSFSFSPEQITRIQYELDQNGLLLSAEQLIDFIKEAIEGREQVKFVFTQTVSEILNLIKQLGKRMSIPAEDMAHLDISQLKQLYSDLYYDNLSSVLYDNIEMNKRQYECAVMLKMPSVILKPEDVYSFYLQDDEPNFITLKSAQGTIVHSVNLLTADLENKIVFIPAADPGYDFLFTKHIAGLVTEYGGTNSHMAIRCAEAGIPAVIGAGQKNYSRWKGLGEISIDCLNHKVTAIRTCN